MSTVTTASRKRKKPARNTRQPDGRTRRPAADRGRPVTAEDLLTFQWLGDPQISPDGQRIAFIRKTVGEKNEYATNLWIVDARGGEPRQLTSGDRDTHPRWSPDGSRLAFISRRKDKHKPQIYTMPADGGEATVLTDFAEGTIETFAWSPDGTRLAVKFRPNDPEWTQDAKKQREEKGLTDPPRVIDDWWYRLDGDGYFNAQRYALYLVEVATGEHAPLYTKDTLGFFSFDWSPDGAALAVITNRDAKALVRPWKDEIVRVDAKSGKVTSITKAPRGAKACVKWSPDGRSITYASREHEDSTYSVENLEVWVCEVKTGEARSLTGDQDYCLMAAALTDTAEVNFAAQLQWSHDSKRIFTAVGWQGANHIASVPRDGGKVTLHTDGKRNHAMGNRSADGKAMAVLSSTPTTLDEVAVARVTNSALQATQLTEFNRETLDALAIVEPTSQWIESTDSVRVQVWMLTPPGFSKSTKYPAILEIHGGPHAQYGQGLFHEMQMLASAGYVVFFANPRGSKGYGRDHCAAIRGRWGTKDWEDIQAVIAHMKKQPFVDTKRLGVMGGSYGGYMTNWAISHCDDFKAAITDRCVSNLHSMFGSSDFIDLPGSYFPGNSWDQPEALWEQSPLKYFGNVTTPTLIIHSEGDLRCNVEQAEQIFAALKLNDVPCRFVRYPRSTSHGMSRGGRPDMRLHRLHQILDWWNRWL